MIDIIYREERPAIHVACLRCGHPGPHLVAFTNSPTRAVDVACGRNPSHRFMAEEAFTVPGPPWPYTAREYRDDDEQPRA